MIDRTEAYKLLTDEMRKLTELTTDRLAELREAPIQLDAKGTDGTLYRIELVVEPMGSGRFAVVGKIHDNNTYRFATLEERLDFEAVRTT